METWQTAVLVRLLAVAIVVYMSRKAMARSTRALTPFGQFAFAAIVVTAIALWHGEGDLTVSWLLPLAVGVLNGLANFFMWNANAISTSRQGFFTVFDDIIAMVLTMLFVPAAIVALTFSMEIGIVLCVAVAVLLAVVNYRKLKTNDGGALPMRFYAYSAGFCLCWGVAIFAIGYFAVKGEGMWRFASGWYTGAAITAFLILLLDRAGMVPRPANTSVATPRTFVVEVLTLGGANCAALALQFTAFRSVSLVALQPAFMLMDLVVPLIIGIFLFKESRQFSRTDLALYAIGLFGFVLIFRH